MTEFSASKRTDTNDFDHDGVNGALDELSAQLDEFFERIGTPPEDQHREFFRTHYWIPSGAASMPWPWAALAYDAAVHHGAAPACQPRGTQVHMVRWWLEAAGWRLMNVQQLPRTGW